MRSDIALGLVMLLMAILGGIVSAHAPTKVLHKWAYALMFVVLGAIGLYFVVKQSDETAVTSSKLEGSIGKLGDSLKETARLQGLNTELQGKLLTQSGTIASLASKMLGQITGGDSFAYFEPLEPMELPGDIMLSNGVLRFAGKDPLHGVFAAIAGPLGWLPSIDYGTVQPSETGRPREMPAFRFKKDSQLQLFHIFINASNGTINEVIRFQRDNGKVHRAFRVWKASSGLPGNKVLHTWIESGYPTDLANGEIDWSKP